MISRMQHINNSVRAALLKIADRYRRSSCYLKLYVIAAVGIALLSVACMGFGIKFAHDPQDETCLPFRYAIILRDVGYQPKRGDIVAFSPEWIPDNGFAPGALLGKQVVAVAGDRVDVGVKGVFVNGIKVEDADMDHEPLDQHGQIQDGHFFGIGTAENSYDSKYYGQIPTSAIYGRVYPIW